MLGQLKAAASHISEMQTLMAESASKLRGINHHFNDALEKELVNVVSPADIGGNICAVDGGLLFEEMFGIDLVMGKAVSVNFEYSGSKLVKSTCFPKSFPEPTHDLQIGLDEHEILQHNSLFRLDLEISNAIEAVKHFNPKALLLDGSIVPLGCDRPSNESKIFPKYESLIIKYAELYRLCKEQGTMLIGVIKDSRGRRFMDSVKFLVPNDFSDALFLNHLLREKERTYSMRYSPISSKHAVLKDLGAFADSIHLFYMKCFSSDRPMRIEFLEGKEADANRIASLIYSLSAINKSYAYPAVLIEADLRAAMNPIELERVKKSLMTFSGIQPLKRNSRPFR
jgi:hypothetical protein